MEKTNKRFILRHVKIYVGSEKNPVRSPPSTFFWFPSVRRDGGVLPARSDLVPQPSLFDLAGFAVRHGEQIFCWLQRQLHRLQDRLLQVPRVPVETSVEERLQVRTPRVGCRRVPKGALSSMPRPC